MRQPDGITQSEYNAMPRGHQLVLRLPGVDYIGLWSQLPYSYNAGNRESGDTNTMKRLESFTSNCGHARVMYDPDWSPSRPYSVFAHGTAGQCFATLDQGVRHLRDIGFKFPKRKFDIVWSPEGRTVLVVAANGANEAKRMTPLPYKRFMGEVYVREHVCNETDVKMGAKCRYCSQETAQNER